MFRTFSIAGQHYLRFWMNPQWTGRDRLAASRLAGLVSLALVAQPAAVWFAITQHASWLVFLADFAAITSFVALLFALRAGVSPYPLVHLFVGVGTVQVAIASDAIGGLFGAVSLISLLVPVGATMVAGPRAGWIWLGIQFVLWVGWTQFGDAEAAAAKLNASLPLWEASIVFSLAITGFLFQGSVTVLYQLEAAQRQELERTLGELEQRVEERTAALSREVEERRDAERAARLANRAKSAFLANMSHELRTPVTTVIGYSELAHEELVEGSTQAVEEDLDRVRAAATHLLGLIDSVLDLARVESGNIEMRPAILTFEAVIQPIVDMIRPLADQRGNVIDVHVDGPGRLYADPERTRQILLNLVSNANKFTEHGRIRITGLERGGTSIIEVADTGRGIDAEKLDAIFERFVQAHETRVGHPGGTGLGLTISRQLAEQMGGALRARSVVGQGSTFILRLPSLPPK